VVYPARALADRRAGTMKKIAVLLVVLAAGVLVAADTPSAEKTFDKATELFLKGKYSEAAGWYRMAYEVEPNTSTLRAASRAYDRAEGLYTVPIKDLQEIRDRLNQLLGDCNCQIKTCPF